MTYTVGALKRVLEDYDDSQEIQIMHQPSWPLVEMLGGVFDPEESYVTCKNCDCEADFSEIRKMQEEGVKPSCCDNPRYPDVDEDDDRKGVIYLVANGHPYKGSPYGTKNAWDNLR